MKPIILRFVRAFVASAVSSMLILSPSVIVNWHDLTAWLSALTIAGILGGVTGLLMALDKAFRM